MFFNSCDNNTVNIETNNPYTVFMDVEFTVQGNADSMTGYRTINIKAGEEKSLLTTYNSGLADIINKRIGLHYTPQALQESTGNIDLRMYGYTSDSTRYAGDDLYQTAVAFDNKLTTTTNELRTSLLGVITGLLGVATTSICACNATTYGWAKWSIL